jgi:hypothetical protein
MKHLKAFYFLTLCALCLYVAIGPAQAGITNPQLINPGMGIGNTTGNLEWETPLNWVGANTPNAALGFDVECGAASPCTGTVGFDFNIFQAALVTISLSGFSDNRATGTVAFYDGKPGGETTQNWTVSGGALLMTPFTVSVPGSYDGVYSGEFTFNLPAGAELWVPNVTSLDFTTNLPASDTPEPGSALLLGAGIAFVGFLRRKVLG